jgi:hypothetical protein
VKSFWQSFFVEELFAGLLAFPAFSGAQCLQPGSACIEYGTGRESDPDQVVAVLPRKNQVMLAAIEAAAEVRPALVDGAAGFAEINTGALLIGGENENGLAVIAMAGDLALVAFDIVSQFGMEDQSLTAAAAFGTPGTGDVGVWIGTQIFSPGVN